MNQHFNLSKSKYCGLWQCPKIAWLQKYRSEEQAFDELLQQRMTVGSEVGNLAKGLFGDYVEVTARDGDRSTAVARPWKPVKNSLHAPRGTGDLEKVFA